MKRNKAGVLTVEQVWLLESAEQGQLRCPDCGEPVTGEFVDLVGIYVGILLYCATCPYQEPLSAPARSWQRSEDRCCPQ